MRTRAGYRMHTASRVLPKCMSTSQIRSPLCGHEISVPCHCLAMICKWAPWNADVLDSLEQESQLPAGATPLSHVPSDTTIQTCLQSCTKNVIVSKMYGHRMQIACADLLEVIRNGGIVAQNQKCQEKDQRVCGTCGYIRELVCSKWQQIDDGTIFSVPCKGVRTAVCWNEAICGSRTVSIPCSTPESATICCDRGILWKCAVDKHELKLNLCARGGPIECQPCTVDALDRALDDAKGFATAKDEKLFGTPMPHELELGRVCGALVLSAQQDVQNLMNEKKSSREHELVRHHPKAVI